MYYFKRSFLDGDINFLFLGSIYMGLCFIITHSAICELFYRHVIVHENIFKMFTLGGINR